MPAPSHQESHKITLAFVFALLLSNCFELCVINSCTSGHSLSICAHEWAFPSYLCTFRAIRKTQIAVDIYASSQQRAESLRKTEETSENDLMRKN